MRAMAWQEEGMCRWQAGRAERTENHRSKACKL